MSDLADQLSALLLAAEDEHLEFKEARNRFDFEELVKYCCAMANEGGGHIVLGVTDRRPRKVVGSRAFEDLQRTKLGIIERLHLRIDGWEVPHADGRVICFRVPSRPVGVPIQYNGAYWMRGGESLLPMTQDLLKRIFEESQPDFSADVCAGATIDDLDAVAVDLFRTKWSVRSRREDLAAFTAEQLLADADLYVPGRGLTNAALILMGTEKAVAQHIGQAELVFEYRNDPASVPYQQRQEFRSGILLFLDSVWQLVNSRNEIHSFREGPYRRDISSFNEDAVREAILNAVCHRDYRFYGSVFIRQSPRHLEVQSPGGFPVDVDATNILFRQSPRNRRLAEALARCGLVERSGQGADLMFKTALEEGKMPPDFSASTRESVSVELHGTVQDEAFIAYLERFVAEKERRFSVADLVLLDAVHRGLEIPEPIANRLTDLIAIGAIERIDRTRLVLSRGFYVLQGKAGEYTRRAGLDRETRKELLLLHITKAADAGAPFEELSQVLPQASRNELKVLLRELKDAARAHVRGVTRSARWHAGQEPTND